MSFLVALLLAQMQAAHPCVADAQKLCSGVKAGHGAVVACLKQHKDQVSQACSAKMSEFQEEAESCKADVEKLCPGSKPGPERMTCMREHKDQVSPECRDFFMKMREHRGEGREAKAACQPDVEKFCGGVQPGEGRVIACLQQHQADLSPSCSSQMKH
jgi:hypothetical protein